MNTKINSDAPAVGQQRLVLSVAFGGGVNSSAMLCGFRERGIVPDLITFADTGGEFPHTYNHVEEMDGICREWWGIGIERVHKTYQGKFEGLEKNCLRKKMLPSLAYGRKACSMKYKVEPQTKRLKQWMDEQGVKAVTRAIGYDAGEGHRKLSAKTEEIGKGRVIHYTYPLVEWGWRRGDCIKALCRHKITNPGKSACFFCPASKPSEVENLKRSHPDLLDRALKMEELSKETMRQKRGLGGENNLWAEWIERDDAQGKLFDIEPMHAPCGCFDG